MSKKLYALISGIIGGVTAIGIAVDVYIGGEWSKQIAVAIPVAAKAIDEILLLFTKKEE